VGQKLIEIGLPVVIHKLPAAAERNGKHSLFQQILSESEVEILATFIECPRLIPIVIAVADVITPIISVVMKRNLITELADGRTMVLVHQIESHRVGDRHVEVVGVTKDISPHYPPRKLDVISKGIFELVSPGYIHHTERGTGRVGEGILRVMRMPA